MLRPIQTLAVTAALMFSASVWSCEPPARPDLPDPATAVTPQMVKAKNDVQAYMKAAEDYLGCGISNKKHNDMVDEMNAVADDFNKAVRDFKARMAG